MQRDSSYRNIFSGASLLALIIASSTSVAAQSGGGAEVDSSELDEIVVTGTRIRRKQTAQPTIEVGSAQIDNRGFTNIADALNELPQFAPGLNTFGTTGTTSSGDNGGRQFVNFFGLGTQRTLTLLNGRRVVSSNSLSNTNSAGVQVDLGIIPTALIERVDVVSVGGAPIYGSDAISGVVNVILKDDFEGLEFDAQYGVTEKGDGDEYRVRGAWGANFADDRGNAVLSLEYTKTDPLRQLDRPDIFLSPGFQSNTSGLTVAGGIVPNQVLVRDQRVHVVTEGGIPLLGDFILDNAVSFGVPLPGGAAATQFDPNGNLVAYNPGVTNEVVFANGGDGLLLPSWVDLRQQTERFVATSFVNYEVADGVRAFAELLFANNDAIDPVNSPFINSNLFPGGTRDVIGIPLSNPFINSQARGVLTSALDTDGDGVADRNVIDTNGDGVPDTPGFFLSQFTDDYQGGAPSRNQSTTYRAVVGLEGEFEAFDREFNFDMSYNFGRTDSSFSEPDRISTNFVNAINAVGLTASDIAGGVPSGTFASRGGSIVTIDGSSAQVGDIVCAASLNPPANIGTPVDQSVPNRSANGCVPLNPLSLNSLNQQVLDYIITDQTSDSRLQQQVFSINLSGDITELPAGPLQFAVGWEHRREFGNFRPGTFLSEGLGDAPPVSGIAGSFTTQEALVEISAPILSPDIATFGPFEIALSFEGAARLVSNSTASRKITYTLGGQFSPTPDLVFRGNYTRSIRAPAITELFLPVQQIDSFATDPCDIDNIDSGPNVNARGTNCIAAVIANGNAGSAAEAEIFLSTFQSIIDNALQPIVTGGNPNLDNEIANSYTIGATYTPSFAPGLSLGLDWVDISINDAIFNVNGTSLLSACFDSEAFPVGVCDSVSRDNNFQVNNLITGFANIGFINFSSVTGIVRYNFDVQDIPFLNTDQYLGNVNFSFNGQYIDKYEISVLGTGDDLNVEDGEPGNPTFSFQANLNYNYQRFSMLWQVLFRGKTDINRNDLDFQTLELPFISSFTRSNVSLGYQITENLRARVIVDNVFDAAPDIQAVASGNATLFDPLGRRFVFGLTATF